MAFQIGCPSICADARGLGQGTAELNVPARPAQRLVRPHATNVARGSRRGQASRQSLLLQGWAGQCSQAAQRGPLSLQEILLLERRSPKVIVVSWGSNPVSLQRLLAVVMLCLLGAPAALLPVRAPALAQGSTLEISMEELVEDTWNNRVVARGNVEIRYYGEILLADEVAYDRGTRKLVAEGNVSLTEASGKVSHTDQLVLNDELRDAFVNYVRRQRMRVDR
jgi:hypothetical protein